MKTHESLKPRLSNLPGVIGLSVFFGILFISSLHLDKKWDAITTAVVCALGLTGFAFALRYDPLGRRAKLMSIVLGALLGIGAAIAVRLFYH